MPTKQTSAIQDKHKNAKMRGLGNDFKGPRSGLERRKLESSGFKTGLSSMLMGDSESLSTPGYVFSSNNSLINYRIGLEREVIAFRKRLAAKQEEFSREIKEKLKDVYSLEVDTYNALGPIVFKDFSPTRNPSSSQKEELLKRMNEQRLVAGREGSKLPEIKADELLLFILYDHFDEETKKKNKKRYEKLLKKNKKTGRSLKEAYEEFGKKLASLKPEDVEEISVLYQRLIGLIQMATGSATAATAVGDLVDDLNVTAEKDGWYMTRLKGNLAEVIDFVELQTSLVNNFNLMQKDAENQLKAEITKANISGLKGSSKSINTDAIASAAFNKDETLQRFLQTGSKVGEVGKSTMDMTLMVPLASGGTKEIHVDVKYTKQGYTRNTNVYKPREILDNSTLNLTREDLMVFKKVLYMLMSDKAINDSSDGRDALLHPIALLLFTSKNELERFLIETDQTPTLITWKGRMIWYSKMIEGIAKQYLTETYNVRFFDLSVKMPEVESSKIYQNNTLWSKKLSVISRLAKMEYKKKEGQASVSGYEMRAPYFLNDKEVYGQLKKYASKINDISISGQFLISKENLLK